MGAPSPRIGSGPAPIDFRVAELSPDSREAIREAVARAMEY